MNTAISRHATRALRLRGFAIVLSAAALLMSACDGAGGNGGTAAKSSAADITGFEFVKSDTANPHLDGSREGKIAGSDIAVSLAPGKALTALVPTITVSPKASVVPASGTARDFTNPVTFTVTAEDGKTKKEYTVTVRADLVGITRFVFKKNDNTGLNLTKDLEGTISGSAINVELPPGSSRTGLTPTITLTAGATVSPAGGVARDFTNQVVYTVTFEGGTTRSFTVTVTVKAATGQSSANYITGFEFVRSDTENRRLDRSREGKIAGSDIAVSLAPGKALTALVPTITVSPKASVVPASGTARDFTNPVTYTVTAEDGKTKREYTVTVRADLAGIKGFVFEKANNAAILPEDLPGTITGTAINVELLPGRSRAEMTPTITLIAGATVSPAGGAARDFTNPVVYTVTLSDNTTQRFTVTVTAKAATGLSSANDITGFKFVKTENLPALANEAVDVDGAIQGTTITATPTSLLSNLRLKPTIVVSAKATVSPESGQAQDFTNPVTYTVTAENGETQEYTVTLTVTKTLLYKDDPSLSAHSDKFSLGDFDGSRLFVGKGFTGADEVGKTLQAKITITKGAEPVHAGTKTAMGAPVAADGSFAFGISNFAAKETAADRYEAWAAIADDSELSIEVVLYAEGGATELGQKSFTATKTADGAIHTWRDLQNMKHKLDGSYTLQNDFAFPATGSEGFTSFKPVAPDTDQLTSLFDGTHFTGSLDGNGKTISGLYVSESFSVGLFGSIQAATTATVAVKDLTLDKPDVVGANQNVGSVAGQLIRGTVSNVTAKDVKVGGAGNANYVGGLVGFVATGGNHLRGDVRSGSVKGLRFVGGLAGSNNGTLMGRSSATVEGSSSVGGLAGDNDTINGLVWGIFSGEVKGTSSNVGGLVGRNDRRAKVYGAASGSVFGGGAKTGGLVGSSSNGSEVRGWSTAAVSGTSEVGGLVGNNGSTDKVQGYALGYVSTTTSTSVGAVIGVNTNNTAADVAVFAGRKQAEETANNAEGGSGDHIGVISTTAPTGVGRRNNNVGTVQVESTTAPALTGLTDGNAQGEWKTETGKKWPVLNFPSDFPGGQPAQDPKIPDKPTNFYE